MLTDIPHIKFVRATNSELFIQQVQLTIFAQLKQAVSSERVDYFGMHEMDRTEYHHLETSIPCSIPKGFELPCTAS